MRLTDIVNNFGNAKVAVLGDFCLDIIYHGYLDGISREAPVAIHRIEKEICYPGAAANVVYNLAKLGVGKILPVGVIGTDEDGLINYGDKLLNSFKDEGIDCRGIIRSEDRKTHAYLKFMARGEGTSIPEQQIHRADIGQKDPQPLNDKLERTVIDFLDSNKGEFDTIVISDYLKGNVTSRILEVVGSYREKFVIGTSRENSKKFKDFKLIVQNYHETVSAYYPKYRESKANYLDECATKLLSETKSLSLIVTLGENGMNFYSGADIERFNKAKKEKIPTEEKKVVDITGAGDTALAAITASLGAGADLVEAAKIGNYAAGIVVQKPGTATASQKELIEEIKKNETEDTTSRTAC